MRKASTTRHGFTLLEIIIALGLSSMIILGLTRLFSTTLWSYSLQDQLTEMNQNARYTIKELSDVLSQAGADTWVPNDTIIKPMSASCNACTVKVNPKGAYYNVTTRISPARCSLNVDNASLFSPAYAQFFVKAPPDTNLNITIHTLDSVHTATNYVYFHPADTFSINDDVYVYTTRAFYLQGSNLCLNNDTNVLAENIDTLSMTFLDKNGNRTALWDLMKSVQLKVVAKTSLADPRYNGYPDHKRRLKLTENFNLRNKM